MTCLRENKILWIGKEFKKSLTKHSSRFVKSPRPQTNQNPTRPVGRLSDRISRQGSLTVEAALALTLFLLAAASFWGLFPAMQISMEIQAALEQASEEMAAAAYGVGKITGSPEAEEEEGALLRLASGGLSLAYARQRVIQLVGAERLEESCVWGGSGGLSFLGSSVLEEERVDLRVSYRVRLPFSVGPVGSLAVSQRSCRRAWTGQLAAEGGEEAETSGTRVYVTENGSVYHTTLDCTYLNLSVTAVSRGSAGSRRNQWGERYTPCQRCAKYEESASVVWITSQGQRYHTDRDCGGLSRNVRVVQLEETILPPCSRCGGAGG